jgi:hypothetical protein
VSVGEFDAAPVVGAVVVVVVVVVGAAGVSGREPDVGAGVVLPG